MDLYEILYRWNLWGDWQAEPSQARYILQEIITTLDIPEVLAIIGPRHAGKSTVTYQLMAHLQKTGVDPKAI
jgi:ABC-type protease/lipase transport system fused ATPase/permease subunit